MNSYERYLKLQLDTRNMQHHADYLESVALVSYEAMQDAIAEYTERQAAAKRAQVAVTHLKQEINTAFVAAYNEGYLHGGVTDIDLN